MMMFTAAKRLQRSCLYSGTTKTFLRPFSTDTKYHYGASRHSIEEEIDKYNKDIGKIT